MIIYFYFICILFIIHIGATGDDEMCNLYLMFYSLSKTDDFKLCFDEQNPGLSRMLPDGKTK